MSRHPLLTSTYGAKFASPPALAPLPHEFSAAEAPFNAPSLERSPANTSQNPAILVVDDESGFLSTIASKLQSNGFDVFISKGAASAERAFASLRGIDLLLTSFEMPDISGLTLAERLSAANPALRVMILSDAFLDRKQRQQVEQRGWFFLNKPFDILQLVTALFGMLGPPTWKRASYPVLASLPESARSTSNASNLQLAPIPAASLSKGDVLLIGNDASLQRSRQLLFERAGFTALNISSRDALDSPDLSNFDVVLICRSVLPCDALQIAGRLHAQNPQLPILRFAAIGESSSDQFATTVTSVSLPALLLTEVERLVSHAH